MASLKGNIIFNGINTATSLLFPIITFPYAARVLLPEGIGAVNFLNSLINYIVLITSLGIPLYAVKEVAKHRDDVKSRDKITIEILLLSILLCIGGYIIVFLIANFVPQIHSQSALFYILSLTIVFNTIGVNWFYQAVEDFKFITIRALIIRTFSAAALFLFVKSSSDLLIYGLIIVGSTVGNNVINLIHLRNIISFGKIRLHDLNLFRHLRPTFKLFVFNLIVSLYISLNSVMLGFISGDEQVGFFTAGTKISHIGLMILTSSSTVLLPRCTNLLAKGDDCGFTEVIRKSLNLTMGLALPLAMGLVMLASPITIIFCGEEYYSSIPILILNAPVIIFLGLTNLMGIQILYPKDKINIVLWSVSIGALVNVVLNLVLIPKYNAFGAAIATFFAELAVLFVQIFMGKRFFPFTIKDIFNLKYIFATAIMAVTLWIILYIVKGNIYQLATGIIIGFLTYSTCLYIMKDKLFEDIIRSLKNTVCRVS